MKRLHLLKGFISIWRRMKDSLLDRSEKNRILFLLDSVVINVAYVLTTGIMISGYAIQLQASDFLVALINSSTHFATIFCLFSSIIFERLVSRKKTLLTMNIVSRTLIFLIVLLPVTVRNRELMLALLAACVMVSDILWGVYRVGWFVWIIDSLPEKERSHFVYFRMFLARIFMGIFTIAAGFILDYFNKQYAGFLIIFSVAYALSILDVLILKRIDDVEYPKAHQQAMNVQKFVLPLKERTYRGFLLFVTAYYLIYTMSTAFTPVYLVKYLNFDYKFISTANVLAMLSMTLSAKLWGTMENKRGVNFVMSATILLTAAELLILSFLNGKTAFLLLVSSLVSGAGLGGFSLASMSYRYSLMPVEGKTIYEGWYYFTYGLGMLLAPFVGRSFFGLLPLLSPAGGGTGSYQALYLLSFACLGILIFARFILPGLSVGSPKKERHL